MLSFGGEIDRRGTMPTFSWLVVDMSQCRNCWSFMSIMSIMSSATDVAVVTDHVVVHRSLPRRRCRQHGFGRVHVDVDVDVDVDVVADLDVP